MLLDMPTVSLVSISVTTILGCVLVFAWWQEATSTLAGWWGLAQLVMSLLPASAPATTISTPSGRPA